MSNHNWSLIHFGKTQQIGQQVINNFGLDKDEVEKLLSGLRCDLEHRIDSTSASITNEVSSQLEQIVENKFIERICNMNKEQVASEERLRQVAQQNYKLLYENQEEFAQKIKAELEEIKEGNKTLEENLDKLCNAANWQAGEAFDKLYDIITRFGNMRWDFSRELKAGWDCIKKADFENAEEFFQEATRQTNLVAEAYFGKALADCKIQILWDEVNCIEQPICYDYSVEFSGNANYLHALKYATVEQKTLYGEFAEEIKYIQRKFREFERKGIDYDCFICVKVRDEYGHYTSDLDDAKDIYDALKDKGYKPFLSEKIFNYETGSDYEAHILYALNTAKCMLIICHNENYLKTRWVRNEYTRFLELIKYGERDEDSIVICFKGKVPIAHLPGIRHKMHSIDLNRINAIAPIENHLNRYCKNVIQSEPEPQEDVDELFNRGYCYANGKGVTQSDAEAVKWYRKAAEQGHARAQFNLGVCYANGRGVTQSDAEAVKWYRKAAEQGDADAQVNLGYCYEFGTGVTQSDAEAVKWYRKAAEQGDASAQFILGVCYELGKGVTQSDAEAVKWYRKAAEQGDADAQFNLGLCYTFGKGVTQSDTEAVKWYRKAAEQGDAEAQFNLGVCYDNGKGVRQSDIEAVKWYRKAAEQGHASAQFNLGVCYANGKGVTQSDAEAVKWYRKAAEQGDADAQVNLGYCYEFGTGVTQSDAEAVKWYRKAAEQGLAEAQFNLGYCYEFGKGVTQSDAEAVKWYRKAAEQGDAYAKDALIRIKR